MPVLILTIYEVLMKICLASVLGIFCGLLSYFLDYCFWKGNIFQWYLPWLASRMVKKKNRLLWQRINELSGYTGSWRDEIVAAAEGYPWFKVLGGCSVCLNVWIGLWTWAAICWFSPLELYYGFFYVLVSSWMIRKLVGAVY